MKKKIIKKIMCIVGFLGLDLKTIYGLRNIFRYLHEVGRFRQIGGQIDSYYPILDEYSQQAGNIGGHYFHQDLLVAQYIFNNNPSSHLDIGSRIDGFVAHVASFRSVKVMDVRPLDLGGHENIEFIMADLMVDLSDQSLVERYDSISCLHAIEHFGLGRYGDTIDPNGHIKGFNNLLKILKFEGLLYISFPIASEANLVFNAHRIFSPTDILSWEISPENKFELVRFDYVDDAGDLHRNKNVYDINVEMKYGCGIYTLRKC